ncbi:unnamed protein product [Meloidogyne enterolobii]|uniref:Uncharacterized protein n=1 Tax=Meloidogyne enterolobii TaxID=390850 RepID=A0ACB1A000_MELEN
MKLASLLIVLIFTCILCAFVKTIPIRKGLARHALKDYSSTDHSKILNDEAESSVNPQIQKYEETLKPKLKITKHGKEIPMNTINRSEYKREYYQKNKERLNENNRNNYEKNKEKLLECKRNYRKQNKEKINEYQRNYYKINKEMVLKKRKIYRQNNREKYNKSQRKYQQKKKNVEADMAGTSFVNPQTDDFVNKGKSPITHAETFNEGNLFNQGGKEYNNVEEELNQLEAEESNKILEVDINQKELSEEKYLFDLNEIPKDEELKK